MSWLIYVLTALFGALNPVQSAANAQLKKSLAIPVWTGVWVYLSGLALLLALQLFFRERLPDQDHLAAVPRWAWIGGFVSVASTMSGALFAQKLGSGLFTGATLTASLLTSILLDHFGWLGFEQHSASPLRLAGAGMLIAGIWLIAKF